MIPLLGVPVLNRPDLLVRLLSSIDYPVGTIAVIDNSCGKNRNIRLVCETFHDVYGASGPRIMTPFTNLGAEPSWNVFVEQFPNMPYWFIVGSDVAFEKGDLEKIHEAALSGVNDPDMAILHAHAMNAFVWLPQALRRVGQIDPNFRPAYLGDCDYLLRVLKAGMKHENIMGLHVVHGEGGHGSSTVRSDASLRDQNGRTHMNNHLYYKRKWGTEDGQYTFDTPFNNFGLPLDYAPFDLDHWRANEWTL